MIVTMSEDAIENYGEQWRGVALEVTHIAGAYMPAKEFFALGEPQGYHPGFDSAAGCPLYDLRVVETGEELPFSLYSFEVQ